MVHLLIMPRQELEKLNSSGPFNVLPLEEQKEQNVVMDDALHL